MWHVFQRWKKKRHAKEKSDQPKLSIWNQMYLLTSMSFFLEDDIKENLSEKSSLQFNGEAVRIYDISDSAIQELEVDVFYSFYLSQAQFEKKPRPLLSSSSIYRFDFSETVRKYKLLEPFCDSELGSPSEFLAYLNFLPKYNRMTVFRFINRPLTLYECAHIESNILRNSLPEYDFLESKWLQLMSWWRLANRHLQTSVAETVTHTDETDFLLTEEARMIQLHSLVLELDLTHGSAELSALRQYIPLDKYIPDVTYFLPSYHFNSSSAKIGFLQSVYEDRRWIGLTTGCAYYSINACFVVLWDHFTRKVEDDDVLDAFIEIFRPLAIEFYYNVILPLSLNVNFSNYIIQVVDKSREHFIHAIQNLALARNRLDVDRNSLNTTITLLTRILYQLVDVIFEDEQIAEFFGDRTTFMMKTSINNFLLDVMKQAVLLAHKVFQRDFVTERLLLTLSRHKTKTISTILYETSCVKLAYILISAYKAMYRTSKEPDNCVMLRSDFKSRDFVMFIDDLRIFFGHQELETEALSMEFAIRWQGIQHRLTKDVEKDLCNITCLAQTANEVLKEAKYIL